MTREEKRLLFIFIMIALSLPFLIRFGIWLQYNGQAEFIREEIRGMVNSECLRE